MIFKQILKQHLRCIQLYTIYMILERIQKESKKNEDGQERVASTGRPGREMPRLETY